MGHTAATAAGVGDGDEIKIRELAGKCVFFLHGYHQLVFLEEMASKSAVAGGAGIVVDRRRTPQSSSRSYRAVVGTDPR